MTTRRIPIFPLSEVTLFPESLVPLHIFEPRYRQMTASALESDRCIGMVTVRPEYLDAMDGDPPVYALGCAGVIGNCEELADGRYLFLLHGIHRFRVLTEVPKGEGRLYRVAEIEPLDDELGDLQRAEAARLKLVERLRELTRAMPGRDAEDQTERLEALELRRFAGEVCRVLGLPAAEKQGLLEADSIAERLERLYAMIAFHLAAGGTPHGSETLH